MASYRGHCLCGALRFTIEATKKEIDACHCGMCRRWHGGPMLAIVADTAPVFDDDGALGVYRSSAWAERWFCRNCGTAVLWRTVDGRFHAVPVGVLEGAADFVFTSEIFVDEKPDYYSFAGDRKTLTGAEVIAAFAGDAPDS